jgi:hypothetical protein
VASSRWPAVVVTVCCCVTPATTCALVMTWFREMTKPEPSMARWQLGAIPCIRTTRFAAARKPALFSTFWSGAGMARMRSAPMPLNTWA